MKVVIISIGKELLTGRVLDTNSNYIAKKLTENGYKVLRVSQIDDVMADIVWEINYGLSFNPDIMITTGGLGPTYDDITLKSLSTALELKYLLNNEALNMVKNKYVDLKKQGKVESEELNEFRKKMAFLPEGAVPLHNPVGAAPGVKLVRGKTVIYSFPGVPSEMKPMFEKFVIGERKIPSNYVEKFFKTNINDESVLNKYLIELKKRFPDYYFKSVPKKFGNEGIKLVVGIDCSDNMDDCEEKFLTVEKFISDIIND